MGGVVNDERDIQDHRRAFNCVCNVICIGIWGVIMLVSAGSKIAIAVLLTFTAAVWNPGGGEFKCFMDYRSITDTSSPQYELQSGAWTDANGLRRVDGYYCVALGSAFGSEIGSKYMITLSTGVSFLAILGDQKADAHTIDGHTRDRSGAVVEFIVDTNFIPEAVKHSGSIGTIPQFSGEVIEIRGLQ